MCNVVNITRAYSNIELDNYIEIYILLKEESMSWKQVKEQSALGKKLNNIIYKSSELITDILFLFHVIKEPNKGGVENQEKNVGQDLCERTKCNDMKIYKVKICTTIVFLILF